VYVQIHLAAAPPAITLEEADDCTRFHLLVVGTQDPARLAEVLAGRDVGRLAGEDAFVRVDTLRSLAAGHVGGGWSDRFDGMVEYARGKGWLDEDGGAIQAHVEWDVPT
jgi:hypothetical protein